MPAPVFEFQVESEQSGSRIDSFLCRHLRNYTSWRIQRIVHAGGATIDFAPAGQTDRVFTGQQVRICLLEPPDKLLDPCPALLDVIYADEWCLVVNKPAGMIVHPVGDDQAGTLANVVQHWLDERSALRGLLRPGMVHRLDRQTSGAIAVAMIHQAHAALSLAFETSRVSKAYLALVEGRIQQDSGTVDLAIGRARTGRHVLMSCRADALDRKPARTSYQVIRRYARHTLIWARPRTGRNHQIRVHLAALGHPLVGDEFYETQGRFKPFHLRGESMEIREVETGLPIRRHALHAARLEFAHPVSGHWMRHTAGLPVDFLDTLALLESQCSEEPALEPTRRTDG